MGKVHCSCLRGRQPQGRVTVGLQTWECRGFKVARLNAGGSRGRSREAAAAEWRRGLWDLRNGRRHLISSADTWPCPPLPSKDALSATFRSSSGLRCEFSARQTILFIIYYFFLEDSSRIVVQKKIIKMRFPFQRCLWQILSNRSYTLVLQK